MSDEARKVEMMSEEIQRVEIRNPEDFGGSSMCALPQQIRIVCRNMDEPQTLNSIVSAFAFESYTSRSGYDDEEQRFHCFDDSGQYIIIAAEDVRLHVDTQRQGEGHGG